MEDFQLTLLDRIEAIRLVNKKYDLENNAYLSFSGGKDSTVLHYLIDLALPNNKIPRVFSNTGLEYKAIVDFVKDLASKDDRFIIIKPSKPIKKMLDTYGYPFKSKEHSYILSVYQHNNGHTISTRKYMQLEKGNRQIFCPSRLQYQFSNDFKLKISDKCCYYMKKDPFKKWGKANNKSITLTGMRKEEGGQRLSATCIVTDKDKNLVKFHPLLVVSNKFEEWFIKEQNIPLCELYKEPFNFERTGCKGCPYSLNLQEQLSLLERYLPNERRVCETIWQPVYEEYRRIGYRLDKEEQMKLL